MEAQRSGLVIKDCASEEEFDIEEALDADDDESINIPELPIKYIIIDCSPINFIDTVGVKALNQVKLSLYFLLIILLVFLVELFYF